MKPSFTQRRTHKKSTIVVSKQTVEQALNEGAVLAEEMFASNQNDPRIDELQNIMDHLSSVLNRDPQEMRADGASKIEDYFDDAVLPEQAQMIKREVDMIAKWRRTAKPAPAKNVMPGQKPAQQVPAMASADKKANAGAAFVTDRDEKGEPKAPEKLEVPRLAAKKKEAVPEPAAPVPPPAAPIADATPQSPAPIPAGGTFDIKTLTTEALAKTVKALAGIKGFDVDKSAQALIEQLTAELKTRPIEQKEQKAPAAPAAVAPLAPAPVAPAPVAPAPIAASVKEAGLGDSPEQAQVELGGLTVAGLDDEGDGPVFASDEKVAALITSAQKFVEEVGKLANGAAGGGWVWNSEKGDVVEDGGRTPEVSEAHGLIDEAPAKLDRPSTELPDKFATETSKAVKEAEGLGNDLKKMYLDAKSITTVNDSRPVREAVESIFRAAKQLEEATKVLNKQHMQEEAEEKAAQIKSEQKKKSSEYGGLSFAAAE